MIQIERKQVDKRQAVAELFVNGISGRAIDIADKIDAIYTQQQGRIKRITANEHKSMNMLTILENYQSIVTAVIDDKIVCMTKAEAKQLAEALLEMVADD